jgi:hypothetical protein
MPLAEPDPAAREATAAVAVLERSPQRGWDRPSPDPDLWQPAIFVVPHHHPAGIARQTLGRLSWNAHPVLEDRLPDLVGVRKDRGVHMDHDLVTLAGGARIDAVV